MKRILIALAVILILIAFSANSCDLSKQSIGGGVRGCNAPDIDPGYLGADATNWSVVVRGQPSDESSPGDTWSVHNDIPIIAGHQYQYAGYQYLVTSVHVRSLTMSVKYIQLC
jgi:hypothetical protein